MLKLKINKGEIEPKYTEIECSHSFADGVLSFSSEKPLNIRNSEIVYLRWDSGMEYSYPVNIISAAAFTIDVGIWREMRVSKIIDENDGMFLIFSETLPIRSDRRDINVSWYLEKEDDPEDIERICNGKYYVKENFFLYRYPDVSIQNTQITVKIGENIKHGYIGVEGNCHDSYHIIYIPEKVEFSGEEVYVAMNPDCCPFHVFKKEGDIKISIPIADNFSTDIFMETERGEGYIQKRVEEMINPILDYEKQPFELYFVNNNKNGILDEQLDMATSLTYKLHFRDRKGDEWAAIENSAWHSYDIDGEKLKKKEGVEDTLSSIAFNDDKIFAETASLKKSFLRLSFYDTPDRKTQNLLFYSTMFFDMSKLKKDAIARIGAVSPIETEVEFVCQNKFMSNVSSEGFYLYLFPKIVQEDEATIYMKAEFNHAGYGYTIPFILPCEIDENTGECNILDPMQKFPIAYVMANESGYVSNMKQLSDDLYTKINVRYNSKKNCYVWYFPYSNLDCDEGNIILELFEPRING